ncbi:MAG: alpha/beta hydrolase-fold protein [Bacteroidota bacterium]
MILHSPSSILHPLAPKLLLSLAIITLIFGCNKPSQTTEADGHSTTEEIVDHDLPKVAYGTIERIDSFPTELVDPRTIDVWLPEGYSDEQKYQVLYMHDGQMLYDSTVSWNKQEWGVDETMHRLITERKIEPTIVVGVFNSGENRRPDYFPQKAFETLPSAYLDTVASRTRKPREKVFSQSNKYLQFLVTEVKPYIDEHFSTRPEKAATFVAGSSMGGLISMYAISEYPDMFEGAACLSTHWIGSIEAENNPMPKAFQDYLSEHLPDPANHKIYFDYGTETLDQYYEPHQLAVDEIMRAKGWTAEQWSTRKFDGDLHDERSWNRRLHIPLLFLLGK